jgi:hypothetical protein
MFNNIREISLPHTQQLRLLTVHTQTQNGTKLNCVTLDAYIQKMALSKREKPRRVITVNELGHNLMPSFISEISSLVLSFKAGHSIECTAMSSSGTYSTPETSECVHMTGLVVFPAVG